MRLVARTVLFVSPWARQDVEICEFFLTLLNPVDSLPCIGHTFRGSNLKNSKVQFVCLCLGDLVPSMFFSCQFFKRLHSRISVQLFPHTRIVFQNKMQPHPKFARMHILYRGGCRRCSWNAKIFFTSAVLAAKMKLLLFLRSLRVLWTRGKVWVKILHTIEARVSSIFLAGAMLAGSGGMQAQSRFDVHRQL